MTTRTMDWFINEVRFVRDSKASLGNILHVRRPCRDTAIMAAREIHGSAPGLILVADHTGEISQIIKHAGVTT